jgi:hypothetical protein
LLQEQKIWRKSSPSAILDSNDRETGKLALTYGRSKVVGIARCARAKIWISRFARERI